MNRNQNIRTFNDLQREISLLKNACDKKEEDIRQHGNAILQAFSYHALEAKLKENLLGNLWRGINTGYYIYKVYKILSSKK